MNTSETVTTTGWSIDKRHTQISFSVKYLLFSTIRGNFKEFDATIYTKDDDFKTATIDVRFNPASINTGVEERDTHLKNADFFDVEKFREIIFTATRFVKTDKQDSFELYGELTMKEIKKEIKLNVESGGIVKDPWGVQKALFSIAGKLNRKDWGFNWNTMLDNGGVLVSDEVSINGEILLIRQS